jgi:hypothetical protein
MGDQSGQLTNMSQYDNESHSPNWVLRPRTRPQISPEIAPLTEDSGAALARRDAAEEEFEEPTETVIDDEKEALKSRLDQAHTYILFLLSERLNNVDQASNSSTGTSFIPDAKVLQAYTEVERALKTRTEEFRQETYRMQDELRRAKQVFEDEMTRMEQRIADMRASHATNNMVQTGAHAQQINLTFQGIPAGAAGEQQQLPFRPAQRTPR